VEDPEQHALAGSRHKLIRDGGEPLAGAKLPGGSRAEHCQSGSDLILAVCRTRDQAGVPEGGQDGE
jgi:hypothetical protein